jgi:F-type H+-transporting ATPase subunit b
MLHIVAATAEGGESANLLSALGIDWALLLQQALAFLVLVAILAKFVYPALMKAVDSRREQVETSMKDAQAAEAKLAEAEEKVAGMLADARSEADDIIARTQNEANTMIAEAEDKAKTRAEQIVADAHTQLEADVRAAREALKKETVELVALATEKIVDEKVDAKKDAKLITRALEERA